MSSVVRFCDKCDIRHLFKLKLICIGYKYYTNWKFLYILKDKLIFNLGLIFEISRMNKVFENSLASFGNICIMIIALI